MFLLLQADKRNIAKNWVNCLTQFFAMFLLQRDKKAAAATLHDIAAQPSISFAYMQSNDCSCGLNN